MTGKNGGGLFVLLFLFFTIVIGLPVFMGELLLGRRAQRGAVGIFENLAPKAPGWKMVGWLSVVSSLLILAYYCVVSGWGLNYILLSLSQFWEGRSSEEISGVFDIMYSSSQISLFWQFIFVLITGGVVYQGIRKGIEHWSKILTSSLLVLLLGLLIYSFTLKGFGAAFRFIFYPDFSSLTPSGILEALGLAFFTLSLGQGIMLTYGSYMTKTEDIPKTAVLVGCMNIVVSILAALMIFPIVFTFGFEPQQGFGLVFKTLPVLFAQLPGALALSTLFFILLVFTALTSSVALLEVIVANFMDLQGWNRKKSTIVAALIVLILGIPCALSGSGALFGEWEAMYGKTFFETIVDLVSQWILPFVGLFVSIFAGWYMSRSEIKEEFNSGTAWKKVFTVWIFFVRWFAPIAIGIIILQRSGIFDLDALFGITEHAPISE